MPPKKKEDQAPPAPEDCLPEGYSVGCDVYWVGERTEFEDSSDLLKAGAKGKLAAVPGLSEYEKEDGSNGYLLEVVEAEFEGLTERHKVPIKSLSLEPLAAELLSELSTGIRLPLRGRDVEQVWAAQGDFSKQAALLTKFLGLGEAYPLTQQREIVCDFHIFNIAHAKSICLGSLQAAVFLAIMDQVLGTLKSQSVTADAQPRDMCSVSACFQEFQNLILTHSISDPPGRLAIFKVTDSRLLTDFASTTFFKHFLLYQYCTNFSHEVQTLRFIMGLERPLPPIDLGHGRLRPDKVQAPENGTLKDTLGETASQPLAGEPTPEGGAEADGPEDQEVERLVQEKLRDTEAKLQAKLDAREQAFKAKLEAKAKIKKPT